MNSAMNVEDALGAMARQAKDLKDLAPVESGHYAKGEQFENFECYVTHRGEHDIVIQFQEVDYAGFPELLGECTEQHFGDTEGFKLDDNRALGIFGFLMEGIRRKPSFSPDHHIYKFLSLVDASLRMLKES